ncbi:metal-dependent hydrolase [Mycolicibacterium mucogenicum]|uniref:Metal-dependent hydrolase n=2 Tax=Mycolicibacterium mucogenicum TaxID=56689 RepID=A0A8H2PF95_MYCMU|nr:metal-dependent hydrolase [Mycolicibacterium mucogenicum]KAB7754076.1 metal-dependent hydrolase [Mycolicibacterium mucogenicum DSM 44124]QPG70855.1 metal-dependent hydrolase [Mycolicibacterium mucogenicum DSM 44124]
MAVRSRQHPTAPPEPSSQAPYPRTRRIRFRFAEEASRKYFVAGDMVFSHFVAGLSGAFPPGEEGFIRSVRRFADRITDPGLKKRVAGFIGQESMHGQEHRHLNEKLVAMGYPIAWWDSESFKDKRIRFEDRLPAHVHLALTAAAEHYTAVLAERVLSSDELQAIPADPEVWHLLNWHALEELEHKSVAFDVYRAVGGTERTRIAVMVAACALLLPVTLISLAVSVGSDPVARRRPDRLVRETYELFTGPIFKGLLPDLAVYLRPGFHPDDVDTSALAQQWRDTLFGADGVLVDHLR